MNTKQLFKSAAILATTLFLGSCSNDDNNIIPQLINEQEVFTEVHYKLVNNADSNDIIELEFHDEDGEGGEAPEIEVSGPLRNGATYTGTIEFFGEHGDHEHDNDKKTKGIEEGKGEGEGDGHDDEEGVEDITDEIKTEGTDHELFFTFSDSSIISITKDDTDDNGNPLGLETTVKANKVGTTTLTITLRHEPKKPNNGTLADAGGETDIEVSFDVEVKNFLIKG